MKISSTEESVEWHGFKQKTFEIDGVEGVLVVPDKRASGSPWIWRTRFFGEWPYVDLKLLEAGFCLAYIDLVDLYGNAESLMRMDRCYAFLMNDLGLSPKTVLEGFSRGALPAYNWASKNPEKVCCIYADAPVCDIKSWPGGFGDGPGSPEDWEKCLTAYGLTEETVLSFRENPIDHLQPLAAAKIPLLHVCGNADQLVPMQENTLLLVQRYRDLGGDIEVIVKEGAEHHPHSLEDPTPIVDFILKKVYPNEC